MSVARQDPTVTRRVIFCHIPNLFIVKIHISTILYTALIPRLRHVTSATLLRISATYILCISGGQFLKPLKRQYVTKMLGT